MFYRIEDSIKQAFEAMKKEVTIQTSNCRRGFQPRFWSGDKSWSGLNSCNGSSSFKTPLSLIATGLGGGVLGGVNVATTIIVNNLTFHLSYDIVLTLCMLTLANIKEAKKFTKDPC